MHDYGQQYSDLATVGLEAVTSALEAGPICLKAFFASVRTLLFLSPKIWIKARTDSLASGPIAPIA